MDFDLQRWLEQTRPDMGGVMKKAKAKKAKAKKAGSSSSGAKGCCTITYENKKDEQVAGITKAECTRVARSRGGVGQWNKGACA
jgi:hypothetical protein